MHTDPKPPSPLLLAAQLPALLALLSYLPARPPPWVSTPTALAAPREASVGAQPEAWQGLGRAPAAVHSVQGWGVLRLRARRRAAVDCLSNFPLLGSPCRLSVQGETPLLGRGRITPAQPFKRPRVVPKRPPLPAGPAVLRSTPAVPGTLQMRAAEPSNRLPAHTTPPLQEYCNCGKQCGCCPSPAGERCEPCRRVGGQGGEPAKPAIQPVVQLVRNAVALLFGGLQWLLLAPLCRSLRCAASQPRPAHPAPSCCRAAVSARRSPAPAPMSATVAS